MSLTRRRAVPRAIERPGRPSRSRWALISAVSVVATCIAVGAVALHPAGGATATTVDQTVGQAVTYAQSTGVAAAVAVYDDQTGKLYTAGDYTSYYGSASVMKLFVATKLLATGQLRDPQTATLAWSMITRSDDAALEALLPRVGGVEVINWVRTTTASRSSACRRRRSPRAGATRRSRRWASRTSITS